MDIQKLDSVEGDVAGVGGQLFLIAQVEEILAQFVLSKEIRGAMKVERQLLHRTQVGLLGALGQATQLHVLAHALA